MYSFNCIIVFLSFKTVWSFGKCSPLKIPGLLPGKMLKNYNFHEENGLSFTSCLKLCTKFSTCLSINYLDSGKCQLNANTSDAAPDHFVESKGGRYLNKAYIPAELAGACLHHSCKMDERCVVTKKSGPVCVKSGVCGFIPHVSHAGYTTSYSSGVKEVTYSCVAPAVYIGGNPVATCQIPGGWTASKISCTTELPMACGSPPTITEAVTNRAELSKIAQYTCKVRNQNSSPTEHCPVSKCVSAMQWTTPTVSCSGADCYNADSYNGKVNCTVSGKPCLVWSQTQYANYGDNNYCSIVGHSQPWCVTDSGWGICYVARC